MLATQTRTVVSSDPAVGETDLPEVWRRVVQPIEPFLSAVARRMMEQVQEFEPEIVPYASYALSAQGKQLRPILVALSGGTVAMGCTPATPLAWR